MRLRRVHYKYIPHLFSFLTTILCEAYHGIHFSYAYISISVMLWKLFCLGTKYLQRGEKANWSYCRRVKPATLGGIKFRLIIFAVDHNDGFFAVYTFHVYEIWYSSNSPRAARLNWSYCSLLVPNWLVHHFFMDLKACFINSFCRNPWCRCSISVWSAMLSCASCVTMYLRLLAIHRSVFLLRVRECPRNLPSIKSHSLIL